MAKQSFKVTCQNIQQTTNRGNVIFGIEVKEVPGANPGDAPRQVAKAGFNFSFPDPKEVKGFEIGKTYTITVE